MTDRERHIERLFRQHYSAMHRLAYLLLHDDDDSKDVVHDVFAKLLVEDRPVLSVVMRAQPVPERDA